MIAKNSRRTLMYISLQMRHSHTFSSVVGVGDGYVVKKCICNILRRFNFSSLPKTTDYSNRPKTDLVYTPV